MDTVFSPKWEYLRKLLEGIDKNYKLRLSLSAESIYLEKVTVVGTERFRVDDNGCYADARNASVYGF